jgi:hypothetical protein
MTQFPHASAIRRILRNGITGACVGAASVVKKNELAKMAIDGGESAKAGSCANKTETAMKKVLILATFASVIAPPAFAQSFDPDLGTGNVVPPVADMGAAGAYAQAPAIYEREYVRTHRAYRWQMPRSMDRDNTSVPGQGVDKDDTTPKSR